MRNVVYAAIARNRLGVTHAAAVLISLFLAARLWLFLQGSRFDADNLTTWMQIADVDLLRNDLLHTLWNLHSQPPLFNFLIGVALKIGGFPLFVEFMHAAVTLAGILAFHALARDLTRRPRLALLLSAWFCVSPAVLLFSQKLYYDAMVPWLLCLSFYGLHFGQQRRSLGLQAFGFAMLAATVLLRSAFHPLIFLFVAATYTVMAVGRRRAVLAAAALPGLAIGLLLLKNAVLFGFFGLSSWAPFNLAHTTVDRLPPQQLAALVKNGQLSKFSAYESFSPPKRYLIIAGPVAPTGAPSLDNVYKSTGDFNYNHIIYVKVAGQRARDALVELKASPARFARTVATSLYHFHRPASEFKGLERNLLKIAGWDQFANAVIGLQPAAWFGNSLNAARPTNPLLQISYSAAATTLLFVAGAMAICRDALSNLLRHRRPRKRTATLIAIAGLGIFVITVSSLFDVWENNRAHYDCGPILLLLAAWAATRIASPQMRWVNAAFGAQKELPLA